MLYQGFSTCDVSVCFLQPTYICWDHPVWWKKPPKLKYLMTDFLILKQKKLLRSFLPHFLWELMPGQDEISDWFSVTEEFCDSLQPDFYSECVSSKKYPEIKNANVLSIWQDKLLWAAVQFTNEVHQIRNQDSIITMNVCTTEIKLGIEKD
jgi:hypothetical protein